MEENTNLTTQKVKDFIERLWYYPAIIPPYDLRRAGKTVAGYVEGGKMQKQWLMRFADLTPSSDILDIGCGDSRLASRLTSYLSSGTYATFEVQRYFVNFLQKNIQKKYKNFSFIYADLYHSYYNPQGKYAAASYIFPFPKNSFDIVFLNSIFTHMLPAEIGHYIREIHRVLRPDGIMLATFFLGNEESKALDKKGYVSRDLLMGRTHCMNYRFRNCWARDRDIREKIVIVDENWIKKEINTCFRIKEIVYGTWPGRKETEKNTQQDIICAVRKKSK